VSSSRRRTADSPEDGANRFSFNNLRSLWLAAVDLPEANDLTVGIMALVAQQDREAISKRTKEALSVARSRGVRLGNPNGAAALRRAGKGGAPLRAAIARIADRHARDLAPVVEDTLPAGKPAPGELLANSTRAACSPIAAGGGTCQRSSTCSIDSASGSRHALCGRKVPPG